MLKDSTRKIRRLKELAPLIKKMKLDNKKIVLGHGVFDFLHYGHMHYLRQAKQLGDVLVVSVVIDKFVDKGAKRPVFNEKTRMGFLAFLECVDYIVPCENYGPWDIIRTIKPDVYVKGEDCSQQLKNPSNGLNKDKKVLEAEGGVLRFTKSLPIHSAELLRNYSPDSPFKIDSFLALFKKKNPKSDILRKKDKS